MSADNNRRARLRQGVMPLVFALAFVYGSVVHWLIMFGVLIEHAPRFITYYFHSLAVVNLIAAYGFLKLKRWVLPLGILIALTQIPAHGYMLSLDAHAFYGSGVSPTERFIDIGFSLILLGYCLFVYRSPLLQGRYR